MVAVVVQVHQIIVIYMQLVEVVEEADMEDVEEMVDQLMLIVMMAHYGLDLVMVEAEEVMDQMEEMLEAVVVDMEVKVEMDILVEVVDMEQLIMDVAGME